MDSVFTYGMVAFAILFLVGGATRVVEFSGLGLGNLKKSLLIAAHLIGCALFSSSIILIAFDVTEKQKPLAAILFFSAMGLLLPLHIFIGIKRRIKIRDAGKSGSS